jgi:hypothetical protein
MSKDPKLTKKVVALIQGLSEALIRLALALK